jgi:hypothetical protein
VERNTAAAPLGIDVGRSPGLLHYASRMEVAAWMPERL